MDEQKIPNKVWWIGAIAVVAIAVGKYFLLISKSKQAGKKKDRVKKPEDPKYVHAELSSQFFLKVGETAYIKGDGLRVKFLKATKLEQEVSGRSKDLVATLDLEITEQVGDIVETATFQLSTHNGAGRSSCVGTGDQLIGEYRVRLLGLEAPMTGGDIPESNEYVANLVIVKEK